MPDKLLIRLILSFISRWIDLLLTTILVVMIILGFYSSKVLNTQFFPNYSIDYITVNVEWPGASPKDIESSIIKPIEEKVRYIDKVKNTKSTATQSITTKQKKAIKKCE